MLTFDLVEKNWRSITLGHCSKREDLGCVDESINFMEMNPSFCHHCALPEQLSLVVLFKL